MAQRRTSRKRAPVAEDLYELRRVFDPQISPDGKRVAYVVARVDRSADAELTHIEVASVDGRDEARAFTGEGRVANPRWSPDGRHLAFTASREESGPRALQLYVAPLEGGEPRVLTRGDASATQPAWSPDGRELVFVRTVGARHGESSDPVARHAPRVIRNLYYRFDGQGLFDERRRHLFCVDVETGEERQLTSGDWHDTWPTFSPDGRSVAFLSDRSPRRFEQQWREDVWLVPARGGRAKRLTAGRGGASAPQFSPDGRFVAWVGHELGDEYPGRRCTLNAQRVRGGRAVRVLSDALDRRVAGHPIPAFGRTFAWLPDGRGLVFLASDRGFTGLHRVDLAGGAVKKLLDAEIDVNALALAPNGRDLLFTALSPTELPELHALSLRGGRLRRLSAVNAKLRAELVLQPLERMAYRSFDGLEIEAFVVHPAGRRRGRRRPLVLDIHGGPHGSHPALFNPLFAQVVAARGYVVLLPNPRGSTGYGESFERAVVGDWAGGDYRDLMAGVDALLQMGVADPERLYVTGYSYGGYLSAWAVTQTPRFRAAVVGAPITNLASGVGTDDIPRYNVAEMGATPWESPSEYASRSPITQVGSVETPVLLVHWEGDLRCPIGQSEEFFTALKLRGVEVEFVRYPGGSHGGRTPSQDVDFLRRQLDWWARHAPRRKR